jgi:putative salt-induced outer membrane protein
LKIQALATAVLAILTATAVPSSFAQVTLKPDGKWRYLLTAGANATSGNSDTLNLNLTGEAARVRSFDKWTYNANVAYGKNNGTVGTERATIGSQYNRDVSPLNFAFGSLSALRDRPANVLSRFSTAGGMGRHLVKRDEQTFDVSAGLGYSLDHYEQPKEVVGEMRTSYGRLEAVLGEESSHKLTPTTSLRQKFTLYPNLRDRGNFRAVFDAGISVAMTATMNLTAGLNYRHDSDPGVGLKRGDAAFVTGVSYRFD